MVLVKAKVKKSKFDVRYQRPYKIVKKIFNVVCIVEKNNVIMYSKKC